ncbi:MAG: hypothetical protein AB1742_02605 [bacterium]
MTESLKKQAVGWWKGTPNMKTACEHRFIATSAKGTWKVKALPTNNRGSPRTETVSTTVFRCSKCGGVKEYPDFWERNYVVPDKKLLMVRRPGRSSGRGRNARRVAKK